jgi:hypothetical protein
MLGRPDKSREQSRPGTTPVNFFVLPNDLPETICSCQTCCSIVVLVRQVGINMVQKSAAKIWIVAAQKLATLASAEVRNRCGLTATPTVESAVILITRASSLSAIGVPFIIHDYFGLMVGAGAGYSLVDSRIRDFV